MLGSHNLLQSNQKAPAIYVPSRTGKNLLLHDGYTFYLKNLQAHGRKQWYCSSRDMAGCRADVITAPAARGGSGDILFLVRGRHIHRPPNYYFTPDGKRLKRSEHAPLEGSKVACVVAGAWSEVSWRARWVVVRRCSTALLHAPSCRVSVRARRRCDCQLNKHSFRTSPSYSYKP
ncbi:hypothetical protein MSG28_008185 [Choristoneura fumiferana]|uniref:Uncharacterized protein n=1 Tax=Choristoneura fumiferana TaxID=7141 RepID=A0ACC0JAG2_CHOFU|nr:hypothetical protein MSG28_008185 [Choristoneura fumiferana]